MFCSHEIRNVLLLGATGFIGSHLLEALLENGYTVVCGVRGGRKLPHCGTIEVDLSRDHSEADWLPRLKGVDCVINAVGILRETADATFAALHVAGPVALFRASV